MSPRNGPNCSDCGRKKGPKQRNDLRCWTCQRDRKKAAGEREHGRRIEALYGLTSILYKLLFAFQGHRCYICQRSRGRKRRLSVDHDHHKGCSHDPKQGCLECVRGLLCQRCNEFLGWVQDDPMVGFRITSYLKTPPFQELRKHIQESA